MALDIPSDQIYGGRYHYRNIERFNILNNPNIQYNTENKLLRDQYPVDTVTFSDEGLAKSKDWREYTKDNPNIQHINYEEQIDEMNKNLHTTNLIDPVSMFNCEIGEVAEQIKSDYKLEQYSSSWKDAQTVIAKAYQVIYDRINEDFDEPNRETTYLVQPDGSYKEETRQDRINALNEAYNRRAEGAAAAARTIAEIATFTGKANYSKNFLDEIQNKVKESYQNAVSEKNMERLRQKVSSFSDYSIDTGISSDWYQVINSLLYGNHH